MHRIFIPKESKRQMDGDSSDTANNFITIDMTDTAYLRPLLGHRYAFLRLKRIKS